jgi:hypothetical protein
MLDLIKKRCGIALQIKTYDDDINAYIEDCTDDMVASGVDKSLIDAGKNGVITAVTCYVKANLGNDRVDSDKYMSMYKEKVFRLTLENPIAPATQEVK